MVNSYSPFLHYIILIEIKMENPMNGMNSSSFLYRALRVSNYNLNNFNIYIKVVINKPVTHKTLTALEPIDNVYAIRNI